MARPTKPKDIKPKAEGEAPAPAVITGGGGGGGGFDIKTIAILGAVILSIVANGAIAYFVTPMVMGPAIADAVKHAGGGEGEEAGHGSAHTADPTLNLELDEFTVNLKIDPNVGGNQYLRSKMSLSVGVPMEMYGDCFPSMQHAALPTDAILNGHIVGAALPVEGSSDYVASGGAKVSPADACKAHFGDHMANFVPSIRDVINAALMKRTAGMLANIEGQEALKDEIKEEVNQFLDENHQVTRVNFEDFIIQR